MKSFAPVINAQEKLAGSKGEPCMVVVDPLTRKLLIPCDSILPTRAQQRPTIPSLCQLFLLGRCRQGANCHQVHAPLDVVKPLRDEVTSLPVCCADHGDVDYAGVRETQSGLSNTFLHLPESTYNKGYIPLSLVSYTIPVSKLLNELPADTRAAVERHRQAVAAGQTLDDTPPLICLEVGNIPICRLHATTRCHYAEECSFLHLCKKVTEQDPQIPLGRRPRVMKTMQKPSHCPNESSAHISSRVLQQQQQQHVNAMRRPMTNFPAPTIAAVGHIRPPCVRGYALTRSPCGVINNSLGNYTAYAALHNLPREQQQHIVQQLQQQQQHIQVQGNIVCGEMGTPLRKKIAEFIPHSTRFGEMVNNNNSMECSVLEFKSSAAELSPMWSAATAAAIAFASAESKVHSSPISVQTSLSDSLGLGSRDEGLSTSPLNLSGSRSSGRSWRHNPYGFNALKALKVDL